MSGGLSLPPHRRAGNGEPLVLVHGFLGGSRQWQPEIAHFSSRFEVIAPDLPGFGDAADQKGHDRIAAMADHVIDLLDGLGIGSFRLLGHSMGGMIAQEIAARCTDRVTKLVLYGTGPLGLMPDRFEPIELSRDRLKSDGVETTIRRIAATWFVKGETAGGYETLVSVGKDATPQAALAALDAMADWDGRDALERLTMPTLIVWGDSDRSYRWPQVERLWTSLPDATLSVIPGTSHAAHMEKPGLFRLVTEDFLTG